MKKFPINHYVTNQDPVLYNFITVASILQNDLQHYSKVRESSKAVCDKIREELGINNAIKLITLKETSEFGRNAVLVLEFDIDPKDVNNYEDYFDEEKGICLVEKK